MGDEEGPQPPGEGGLRGWIFTVDNVRTGVLWLGAALLFLLLGGLVAVLLRLELLFPGPTLLEPQAYNEMFTLHGTFMVFFFAVVVFFGLGSIVVPAAVGARQMAFHRLNALDFWLILLGGLVLEIPALFGERPAAGWTSYVPLSLAEYSPGRGQDWWVAAIAIETLGGTLAGANFLATILREREPGRRLRDLSILVWTIGFASVLALVAGPFLLAALAFLYLDRNVGTLFFAGGSGSLLWQDLFWFYSHPATYVMVVPAFGVIAAVVARFAGGRLLSRWAIILSAAAITVLGFLVWWHHMFLTGMRMGPRVFAAIMSWAIAIPSGVLVFTWIGSLRHGVIRFTTPMLFALGFVAMFTLGGANGLYMAYMPFDFYVHGTYWLVAHIHYIIFGGTVLGIYAAIYYWFPAALHKQLDETLGKWHFWGTMVGMNLTFLPMHWMGLAGMPRRVWDYDPSLAGLNAISTTGMFLVLAATAVFVLNVALTLARGPVLDRDPWRPPTEGPDA